MVKGKGENSPTTSYLQSLNGKGHELPWVLYGMSKAPSCILWG